MTFPSTSLRQRKSRKERLMSIRRLQNPKKSEYLSKNRKKLQKNLSLKSIRNLAPLVTLLPMTSSYLKMKQTTKLWGHGAQNQTLLSMEKNSASCIITRSWLASIFSRWSKVQTLQATEDTIWKDMECCLIRHWLTMVLLRFLSKSTRQSRHPISWRNRSWKPLASSLISQRTCTKSKVLMVQKKVKPQNLFILSLLPNSRYLLYIWMNGSSQRPCQSDMQVIPLALEKRRDRMVVMYGESSEFISSKKSNNSSIVSQANLGRSLRKW